MPNPVSRVTTLLLSSLLIPLLCTCDRAQQQQGQQVLNHVGPTRLAGTLRYQQGSNLLEATLQLHPAIQDGPAPLLLGTPLEPLATAGAGRFRARRTSALPTTLSVGIPCSDREACTTRWEFTPPFPDSIPPILSKSKMSRIRILAGGLTAEESLVMFFEPVLPKTPRRLQLIGPTSTAYLTLRSEALSDIPTGDYRVYFVKQQLHKDSTASLVSSMQTEYFTTSREVTVTE